MNQETIQQSSDKIEKLSSELLKFIQDDTERTSSILKELSTIKDYPVPIVQLYGVSQAGKSTLVAFFTNGNQYAPVGDGLKTTIINTKIIYSLDEKVVFTVKTHEEILSTFLEGLIAFIPWEKFRTNSRLKLTDIIKNRLSQDQPPTLNQALKIIDLNDKEHREIIYNSLDHATRVYIEIRKKGEKPPVSEDDIIIGKLLIQYFDEYQKMKKDEQFEMPLETSTSLIRRPVGINITNLNKFTFQQVKPFFIREAEMHVKGHPSIKNIHLVDGPGFGVSTFDNQTCRTGLKNADAVLLVLGSNNSELNEHQVENVQSIVDLVDKEVFVVWNAKNIYRGKAKNILSNDIKTLNDIGLRSSLKNSCVIDARLGLRGIQLYNFGKLSQTTVHELASNYAQADSLNLQDYLNQDDFDFHFKRNLQLEFKNNYESFERDFMQLPIDEDIILQGINRSGFTGEDSLESLFKKIRNRVVSIKLRDKIDIITSVAEEYLSIKPTVAQQREIEEIIRKLRNLQHRLSSVHTQAHGVYYENKYLGIKDKYIRQFSNYNDVNALLSRIKTNINSSANHVQIASSVSSELIDFVKNLNSKWTRSLSDRNSNVFESELKPIFLEGIQYLLNESYDEEITIDLQGYIAYPNVDISNFTDQVNSSFYQAIEDQFGSTVADYIKSGLTYLQQKAKQAWEGFRNIFRRSENKVEIKSIPRLDKDKIFNSVKSEIEYFLKYDSVEEFLRPSSGRRKYQVDFGDIQVVEEQDIIDHGLWIIAIREISSELNSSFSKSRSSMEKFIKEKIKEYEKVRDEMADVLDDETREKIRRKIVELKRVISID